MPDTKTFDPSSTLVTIGAWPVTGGWAPGTYIKASRRSESFKDDVGAVGDVVRIRNRDRRGTIELTFLRTAAVNDYLSSLMAAAEQFNTGIVPITIEDRDGTTKIFGAECWITKPADVEESAEGAHRTWTFAVSKLEMFIGGNLV